MFVVLLVAMLMMFGGATFLREPLDPHQHPGWFIVFWVGCAWLTLTALLLAVFDVLLIRAQARAAQAAINRKTADAASASERSQE